MGRREKEQTGVSPAVSLSGLQAPSRATAVLMGPRAAASRPPPPKKRTCRRLLHGVPLTPFLLAAKVWRRGEGYSGGHSLCSSRASEQDFPKKPY